MRFYVLLISVLWMLSSCEADNTNPSDKPNTGPNIAESTHPYSSYFYPYDTIPRIYQYRDAVHGFSEEFHRVYGITDGWGPHIVIEKYESNGRLKEVYNYNLDSLNVLDHVVVNSKAEKEKATIYKNELLPKKIGDSCEFASKFSGGDSTVMLMEWFRKAVSIESREVMSKQKECLILDDTWRYTLLNPFTREENESILKGMHSYAKGIGLVEWMDENKKVHWVLEEIISQKRWIKLISL